MFNLYAHDISYQIPQDYLLVSLATLYFITMITGLNILSKIFDLNNNIQKNKSKNKFQYLLESPNNYNFDSNYLDIVTYDSSPLIKCLDDFCKTHSVYDSKGIIVSLSGGVDSMVTLAILLFLQKTHDFNIYTASIDYGLRDESNDESEFLIEYTKTLGVKSYVSYVFRI